MGLPATCACWAWIDRYVRLKGVAIHGISERILLLVAAFALFLIPVSAIAAGGFTDVEDDSLFIADIQWMGDNGITAGRNPPTNDRYCPKNNVTREQMSGFMHRLAVNQIVDAAIAVRAGKVDGHNANDLARSSYFESLVDMDNFDSGPFVRILRGTVTAPENGILPIWANVNAERDIDSGAGNNTDLEVQIFVDGAATGIIVDQEFTDVGANSGRSINVSVAFPVTTGDHTVDIRARRTGISTTFIEDREVVTLCEPFGNAGTAGTLGFTPSGSTASGNANAR